MAIYAIRDLEKLTGIKAHTIRIWEQRYHLVIPSRTATNIRYYTDEHLRQLLNVAVLNRKGFKISKIAEMTPDQIARLVADLTAADQSHNAQIDALTLAMINLDESAFERIFVTYVSESGFERTMIELIYPFLDKLSVLWITRSISPAHEKFVTNLIRRKIISAIDQVPCEINKDASLFVLYSPEGENQELTLLFVQYLLRSRRQRVIYLGSNTSLNDVRDVCQPLRPDYVFTILQEPPHKQTVQAYIDNAAQTSVGSKLLLTGVQLFSQPVSLPKNAVLLNGLYDTLNFIESVRTEHSLLPEANAA
ncbi:MAG: MerR family transcriptional regulator [Saprospiraceae bacterium]|nr:MerR family transcriptional regulator [Saprospiraceae bacterium]